jgi:hypothetical protein
MQAWSTAIGEKFNQIKHLQALSKVQAQNKKPSKTKTCKGH